MKRLSLQFSLESPNAAQANTPMMGEGMDQSVQKQLREQIGISAARLSVAFSHTLT